VQVNPSRQDLILTALLIAAFTAVSVLYHRGVPSSDLMALYLAGQEYAAGNMDGLYPVAPVFDLSVPVDWRQLAAAHGLGDMVLYPFIYPPLWAAVMAPLSTMISPQTLFFAATVVNPILLGAGAVLTWRILRPAFTLPRWVGLCLLLALLSHIGLIALYQNQPQILVSCLILLAIERARADAPVAAGAVLALAAAIKLYPLFFVVIWLASGNRRAVLAFSAYGAALGGLSLLLAPIATHQQFLAQLAAVADTVVLTNLVYTFETALGQFALKGQFTLSAIGAGFVAAKPLWLGLLGKAALVAALALIWRAARRASSARLYTAIWPAALILVSLFGPLAWAYHYLTVTMFLPALLFRPTDRLLALALFLPLSLPVLTALSALPLPFFAGQLAATLALTGLAALFWARGQPDAAP